jgi:hypothetical protein
MVAFQITANMKSFAGLFLLVTLMFAATPVLAAGSCSPNSCPPPLGTEMVVHAYAAGCAALTGTPTMIIRWDSTPVTSGDSWQVVFAVSDSIHNETLVATATTIEGQHNFTETFYVGSTVASHQVVRIPSSVEFPGDFGRQEFTDFYMPSGEVTFFWYTPHAGAIQAFGSLNIPHMTPTDVAVFFAPIKSGQPLSFNLFRDGYFDVGQQSGQSGPVVEGAFNSSPCATPLSLALSNNINTNACEESFTAGGTSLTVAMVGESD